MQDDPKAPLAAARVTRMLAVKEASEPWTEYLLEDGTKVRARVTMMGFRRIVGRFAANGDPEYEWQVAVQSEVAAPDELRKPPDGAAPQKMDS